MSPEASKASTPTVRFESLEDAVYKPYISDGNTAIQQADPKVTIPLTLAAYTVIGIATFYLAATKTEVGQKIVTSAVNLLEVTEENAPPPPPPPPSSTPPAPSFIAKDLTPITPDQNSIPETPKELPKQDLSNTGVGSSAVGMLGGVAGGQVGGAGRVIDFDFSQVNIKYQPPAPAYPAMAKMARIQGTVVAEITIGPDGIPASAVAKEGPAQLRQHAVDYAMKWRFEPATLNGQPQYARFKLIMPFRLN